MPHGTPDWGLVGPKQTIYGLDDLGEHAVRAGSPHLWDRRGDVYHQTNFSEGLEVWRRVIGAAGDTVILYTGVVRHGAFSVQLTPGSPAVHQAGLINHFPIPRLSGIGLEYSFSTDDGHKYWYWGITQRRQLDEYEASVRFDVENELLEYLCDDGRSAAKEL